MGLIEWQYTTEGYVESIRAESNNFDPMTREEFEELEEAYDNGNQH